MHHLIHKLLILLTVLSWSNPPVVFADTSDSETITIGITPVMLDDRIEFLNSWKNYLETRLKHPVKFVQRQSYQEMIDLLLSGKIHFAWLCGYPYVQHKKQMTLVTVPLYHGKPYYQSYLIVNAKDKTTHSVSDLKGRIFAYSDPNSNSGYLTPQYELSRQSLDANTFFRKTFFTWSHSDVIRAVSDGVADAGAVDGYIWDTLEKISPDTVSNTRIAWKSVEFGFPPIVSLKKQDSKLIESLRNVLQKMKDNTEGKLLLKRLNLDGFSVEDPGIYDLIKHNMLFVKDTYNKHAQ